MTGIKHAAKRLAVVRSKYNGDSPTNVRKVPWPALCPPDSKLWKVRSRFKALGADFLLGIWEQFSYGFYVTQDLAEFGYTESSWLEEHFKEPLRYYRGGDTLLPLLLYCIAQHPKAALSVAEGAVVVTLKGERIGVAEGVLLARHTPGFPQEVDASVLLQPMNGFSLIADQVSLRVYASIIALKPEKVQAAMQYLSYLLFHLKGERKTLKHLVKIPSVAKYAALGKTEPKTKQLPTPQQVANILLNSELENPLVKLRPLTRKAMTTPDFYKVFGRTKLPNPNHRYKIYYRYADYYNENGVTKC